MFIVCRFPHTKSPAVPSQTAPYRYCLLHLVPVLLPAGPCMVRQLKAHLVSGVAPGRAYCSAPVCRPGGWHHCREAHIWAERPPLCQNQRAHGVLGLQDALAFQDQSGTTEPYCIANVSAEATSRKLTLLFTWSRPHWARWRILNWQGNRKQRWWDTMRLNLKVHYCEFSFFSNLAFCCRCLFFVSSLRR